ncbi:dihydroxyacetone kinase subunit L [Clostridium sp. W14A]|nr:dihydroxyacetone kinase subunit L [Clostridium sp. W14A]
MMKGSLKSAMEEIASAIKANKDYLTDLDREIGDADHGINMARGFDAVMAKLNSAEPADLSSGLRQVALTLISTVGGASGPLYGTAFLRAGKTVRQGDMLNPKLALSMFRAAVDGVEERGKAEEGDKTMVDALEPAYRAFEDTLKSGGDFPECLEAARDASKKGVEYTKTIPAKKGRASYLGERSIGHQDPGATSVWIILNALLQYAQKIHKEQ